MKFYTKTLYLILDTLIYMYINSQNVFFFKKNEKKYIYR